MALEAFLEAFPEMAGIGSDSDSDDEKPRERPFYDGNEALNAVMMSDSIRSGNKSNFGLNRIKNWIDQLHYETMIEKIGNFPKWNKLPDAVKSKIISHLHLYDRYSLMYCSKAEDKMVQSVPIILSSIEIADEEMDAHSKIVGVKEKNISIRIWSERPDDKMYILFVKEKKNNTKLYRFWLNKDKKSYTVRTMVMNNRDYMKEAVKFVEKLLKSANYRVDEFTLSANNFPINPSTLERLKVAKELIAVAENRKDFVTFLNTAEPGTRLDYLEIGIKKDISDSNVDHYDHETLKNAKKLILVTSSKFAMNDQQFLNLKCEEASLMVHTISDVAVNTFVKKWINGEVRQPNFRFATVYSEYREDKSIILSGIEYFKWDATFRSQKYYKTDVTLSTYIDQKFPGMTYYYIENKKKDMGATLAVGYLQVALIVTGKRRNRVMDETEIFSK